MDLLYHYKMTGCRLPMSEFLAPLYLSLKVTLLASIVVLLLGALTSWWMKHHRFRGKTILETLFMLPLVLPPTVVGFILLVLLGKRSWLGYLSEFFFQHPIIFTWGA